MTSQSKNDLGMPEFKNASEMMMSEIQALMPVIQNESFRAPRVQYPEERFKKYFAPFFLGVFEVPANENIQMLWVSEVGSLHMEVDIVDPAGNVLFVVPPFINLEGINLHATGMAKVRFATINQVFEEDSRNYPEKARTDYYQGLSRKLSSAFKDIQTDPVNVNKWLKIFEYYGVVPPSSDQYKVVPNGNASVPGTSAAQASGSQADWSNIGQLDFNPTFD